MTNLKLIGMNYAQEVEREGRYFGNIRSVVEANFTDPGEELEIDVELVPVTNYYGDDRAIVVRDGIETLGILPDEDVDTWWPLLCAMHDAQEEALVPARIWTSRDWEKKFYASVRLDMPPLDEAEQEIADNGVELTKRNRAAWKNFNNELIEYWDKNWVAAHGMTPEEVEEHARRTSERLEMMQTEREAKERSTANSQSFASTPQAGAISARETSAMSGDQVINRPMLWGLWLLTGLLGGHRYYLGNIGMGILQTITFGGFGVWWIIDAFLIRRRAQRLDLGAKRWTF